MTLKYESVLVAELVRREENGKLFVVGVFGANVALEKFPAKMSFTFLIIANAEKAETHNVQFRVKLKDSVVFTAGGEIKNDMTGRILLPIACPSIDFTEPEIMKCEIEDGKGEWRLLHELPIQKQVA